MSHSARTTAKTALAVLVVVLAAAGLLLHADVPQVPSNFWAPAGDMASIRAGATGTLLPNGFVLVAGGVDANGATSSVERFSPDGAHFIDAPSMQMPRANHTATLLADGRVLVAGGTGASGAADATAEIYDSAANAWMPAGSLNVARRGHTATRLPDGKVLIAGGDDNGVAIDSLEVFDPDTALFTVVDGASTGARTLHAAAALLDGRVLIAGGFDGTNPLASTSIYDPETNTVSAGPDLSTPRSGLTATTLLDGRVLLVGGAGASGELASAEIFDPATSAFTPTDNTLSSARQNHLAFLLPHNNQVLIVGGLAGGNAVAAAEYFTPWEGTNGVFCAQAICASGYQGPAIPATAREWAAASALSFPADKAIRTGPNDGLLLLAGGNGQHSAELFGFATIRTDKEDYSPGETVTITGSGWQPHESVALVLRESPSLDEHPLLSVEADDSGNIESTEFVPDEHDVNIRFYLTAYGGDSQAQTTFRDGNANVTGTVIDAVTLLPISGATISCTTTSGCNANLSTTTTASGNYFFTGAAGQGPKLSFGGNGPTTLTLSASKVGYVTGTLVISNVNNGDTFANENFSLTPSNTAPTADAKAVSTNEDTPLAVPLTGSDPETCNLTFSIVTPPSSGSLGSITNNACVSGTPNTDSASVTYSPNANFNGADSFTYRVNDGSLNSTPATVSITVNAVNDAPSFTKGADQTVLEDAAAQSVAGWATAISKGPSDENGQTVNFNVSNDNNALFSAQPAIAANGTLTYTPAPNANGSATVSVQIHDNGGTANGGVDTSTAQTFRITVTPV
ncbi:MAG TPA: kelch repeat-containing protein, partial [Vicinamibacterales bacterium]